MTVITRFCDLPFAEQLNCVSFMQNMKTAVDANTRVPNEWKGAAYEYVTRKCIDLALQRLFQDLRNIPYIDYSQFYLRQFAILTRVNVTDTIVIIDNRAVAILRKISSKSAIVENHP